MFIAALLIIGEHLTQRCSSTNEWVANWEYLDIKIPLSNKKGRNYLYTQQHESQNNYTERTKPQKIMYMILFV